MTTQEQVKSETSPVSTHPRSVNLTSPMLRTKSLCYRVLVPETCTDVAILHANAKTETCTPRKVCMHLFKISPLFQKTKPLCWIAIWMLRLLASLSRIVSTVAGMARRAIGYAFQPTATPIKAQNCSTAGPAQAKESEQIKSLKFVDIRFFQVQQQRNAISGTFTRDSI